MLSSVEVKNLSKKFRIYHEKRDSVYEGIIGWFSKRKNYEDLEVLRNVSFDIKEAEMFGIIGKNGSGKTTLLRIIAGIYKPDKGSVSTNGSIIPILGVGLGFEMDFTARANVIEYGMLLGLKKQEIQDRVEKIIEFAELEKFADIKIKNFSTGMYARLAFSIAIQANPDILIIDEVLQVGDLPFRQKCLETILSFKKKGKSIIFVSHDTSFVSEHCDRVMWLDQGKIVDIGEPQKVVDNYVNSFSPS